MASLSEKLRRERELRGISLKQISEDTKIGVRFLEALEEDKLEVIPGEFYRRSYLRAYARYLGLDEDRAVNAYAFANQEKRPDDEIEAEARTTQTAPWLPWVVGACVLFLVVVLFLRSSSAPPDAAGNVSVSPDSAAISNVTTGAIDGASSPSPDSAPTAPADPASVPSTESRAGSVSNIANSNVPMLTPSSNATAGDGALRVVVAVSESCWLEIQADGDVVTTGLMEEGFRRQFTADREVRLWLGNAGGVSLWVNGRPLRSLGRAGQVRKDVSITPDNYLSYVREEPGPS